MRKTYEVLVSWRPYDKIILKYSTKILFPDDPKLSNFKQSDIGVLQYRHHDHVIFVMWPESQMGLCPFPFFVITTQELFTNTENAEMSGRPDSQTTFFSKMEMRKLAAKTQILCWPKNWISGAMQFSMVLNSNMYIFLLNLKYTSL